VSRALEVVHLACPVCGKAGAELFYQDPRVDTAQTYNRHYLRCVQCGLIYVSPRRADDEYYRSNPNSYTQSVDTYTSLVSIPGLIFLLDLLEVGWRSRSNRDRGRLLEVGSAAGYFLDAARARGWSVKGVEPSSALASWSSRYLQLDVDHCAIEDAVLAESAFDAVAAIEVVEHVRDPAQFASRANALLKPGGLLFLTTPNLQSKDWEVIDGLSSVLEPRDHLTLFTVDSVRRLLDRAEFQDVRIDTTGGKSGDAHLICYAWRRQ